MSATLDRSAPPVIGPPPALVQPHVQALPLRNGMQLLVVEERDLPVVDVVIVARAGAVADQPALAGRATLAADMLDEGTTTRSALDIAAGLERLGAALSTRAGWDDTTLSLHVLAPRLEPALDIMTDVLMRPSFPPADFERKKNERLAQLLQEQEEPRVLANNAFAAALYGPDHPYGASIAGTPASVAALQPRDIADYYASRVGAHGSFIVVAGDVDAAATAALFDGLLGDWRGATEVTAAPVPSIMDLPARVIVVDRPGAPQSELRIGLPGPPRSTPDYFPLVVMNTILGGAFTSRLNIRLRQEKGFTYGAGSGFGFRAQGGPFVASTAVHTEATAESIAIVLEELRRMAEEPVGAVELERARDYLALGLARRFETTADIARHVAELQLYGLGSDYYSRYVDEIRRVSAEDVQRAARLWLRPDRIAIVVAGDRTVIEPTLAARGLPLPAIP